MSESHPERPEPAHGPQGDYGGLEDLSGLDASRESGSASPPARSASRFTGDAVAGGEMRFRVTVDGVAYDVAVEPLDRVAGAVDDPGVGPPSKDTSDSRTTSSASGALSASDRRDDTPISDGGPIVCPVAGVVVKLLVAEGETVAADQPVAIVEALKVESRVLAPREGVVSAVLVAAGDRVRAGDVLVRL